MANMPVRQAFNVLSKFLSSCQKPQAGLTQDAITSAKRQANDLKSVTFESVVKGGQRWDTVYTLLGAACFSMPAEEVAEVRRALDVFHKIPSLRIEV